MYKTTKFYKNNKKDSPFSSIYDVDKEKKKKWVFFRRGLLVGEIFVSLFCWMVIFPCCVLVGVLLRGVVQSGLDLWHGKGKFSLASGIDGVFGYDRIKGKYLFNIIHNVKCPNVHKKLDAMQTGKHFMSMFITL
jgi:hypothetical protein